MKAEGSLNHVSAFHALARYAGCHVTSALLPCRVVDRERGLSRAERILAQGYGLIVTMNHFSFRDAPQTLSLLCRNRTLRRREILAPTALHQLRRYEKPVRACAALFGVRLAPVVTRHTESQLFDRATLRHGLLNYVAQATAILGSGGIVLLAPQGSRQRYLGQPAGRPVAQLLRRLDEAQRSRVALMFIGLSIPGEVSYTSQNVGALNLARHYEARIGATFTVPEALREVPDLRAVDGWVFERLRSLVAPAYLESGGLLPGME